LICRQGFAALAWQDFSASPAHCVMPDDVTQQQADEPGTKLARTASVARIRVAAV
jgi:hypothetical protein